MGTSRVCSNSLDLKRYLLTPTSCPKPKTSVLSTNQDACPLPTLDGDEQKTLYTSKTVEQNGTKDPPLRRKMGINKTSKNISQGQKRKNFANDTSTRSVVGHETHEKGDSSCPAASQRKKARISNQNKDSNTDRTILTDFSTSLNYHDPDHSLITRCETLITKIRICIDTTSINNFNVCEILQKERIVSETKLSPNFNSLQLCELRPNDTTKRPVMGKTAKFASIDSRSLDVLKEIKIKVHIKYGDKKRRRVKTNGILTSAVGCRSKVTNGILKSTHKSCTTVTDGILKSAVVSSPTRKYGVLKSAAVVSRLAMKDKRAVFRWIGICKKIKGLKKKISLLKKKYNSICCM